MHILAYGITCTWREFLKESRDDVSTKSSNEAVMA